MPRYFFHVHDGSERPDTEGTDLAGMGQVRSEAVRLTGEILRDMGGRFWWLPEWRLTVTDETGAEVLGLRVSANEPGRENLRRRPRVARMVLPSTGAGGSTSRTAADNRGGSNAR